MHTHTERDRQREWEAESKEARWSSSLFPARGRLCASAPHLPVRSYSSDDIANVCEEAKVEKEEEERKRQRNKLLVIVVKRR